MSFIPPNVFLVATTWGYRHYKNGASHITYLPPYSYYGGHYLGLPPLFYTAELDFLVNQ